MVFESVVIPALEAKGLGEKYARQIARGLWGGNLGRMWGDRSVWSALKAPLSLRARAALTVLEAANG